MRDLLTGQRLVLKIRVYYSRTALSARYLPVAVLRALLISYFSWTQYLFLNTIKYLVHLVDILLYTLNFSGILNDL
jgi:hypothetical protein